MVEAVAAARATPLRELRQRPVALLPAARRPAALPPAVLLPAVLLPVAARRRPASLLLPAAGPLLHLQLRPYMDVCFMKF